MTSPRIQDAEGRELSVGDRVVMPASGAMPAGPVDLAGKVHGIYGPHDGMPATVDVKWPEVSDPEMAFIDTYYLRGDRCPDLLLIDQDDKGGGGNG